MHISSTSIPAVLSGSGNWDGSFLTIDGYAIETEAGTAIEAGAIPGPGAMGLLGLAAGASGLRRKRQA